MKWIGILVAAALLAMTPGYGGAQSPLKSPQAEGTQVKGRAVEGQTSVQQKPLSPEERKDYEKKVAAELEALDTRVADLRMKTAKVPPQQKRMVLFHMNYLYNEAVTARNQLRNLVNSQGEAWNQAQGKLAATMQDLTRNLEAAENKYR
jgi:hypothetical protein